MECQQRVLNIVFVCCACRNFAAAFDTFRPLSYTDECVVTTARCKTTGQCVVVKKYTKLDLGALALLQVGALAEYIAVTR
eukprot:350388-Chlamydomonas_euryale.AAC.7